MLPLIHLPFGKWKSIIMKNFIPNSLSIIFLATFWFLAAATQSDETLGEFKIEADKTPKELILKNNDTFDYEDLSLTLSYHDTFVNANNNDTIVAHLITNEVSIKSMESKTIPFADFTNGKNVPIPVSIVSRTSLNISGDCLNFDRCFNHFNWD